VGCSSHRLNLAVQKILEPFKDLLLKIEELISTLATLKNRGRLRESNFHLVPLKRNITRWSSTYYMLKRYIQLYPVVRDWPPISGVQSFIPTAEEHNRVLTLLSSLEKFHWVTKTLQSSERIDFGDVRVMFDKLIEEMPDSAHYLQENAEIVLSPLFESAARKVNLKLPVNCITSAEAEIISPWRIPASPVNPVAASESTFAQAILLGRKRLRSAGSLESVYKDMSYIPITTNHVERLF